MRKCLQKSDLPWQTLLGRIVAAALLLMLLLRLCLELPLTRRDENAFYVFVLDVGQSDAILLRAGEATMLIDTGSAANEAELHAALLKYHVDRLDYLLLTHPHEDHIGNARSVIACTEVATVLLPDIESEDVGYQLLCESAAAKSTVATVTVGERFALGDALIEVLSAGSTEQYTDLGGEDENVNNAGTVLRVAFGKTVFLFMGDAEADAEAYLLDTYGAPYLDCDFLKVGHHGSNTATTAAFVLATTPVVAAISCGKHNTYGFPHSDVIENLTAVGANVFRTDTDGILVFGTDGNEIRKIPPNTKGL